MQLMFVSQPFDHKLEFKTLTCTTLATPHPSDHFTAPLPTTRLIQCLHTKLKCAGSRASIKTAIIALIDPNANDVDGPRPPGDEDRVVVDRTINGSYLRATGRGMRRYRGGVRRGAARTWNAGRSHRRARNSFELHVWMNR